MIIVLETQLEKETVKTWHKIWECLALVSCFSLYLGFPPRYLLQTAKDLLASAVSW